MKKPTKLRKRRKATVRKPRRRFHVIVHSNWDPGDWAGGVSTTISTAASLGPGKAVVKRILRDVIAKGIVSVVDELCLGSVTVDQALDRLMESEAP